MGLPEQTAGRTQAPACAGLRVLYGGTFDPVHNGHLATARAARDRLGCTVWLMPAADPPHRAPPGASAAARAHMLALAVAGESGLAVDRRELRHDGPSYTVRTLRALRQECGPSAPVALLLGADSFLSLPAWREWEALFTLAHLVVAERPGSPLQRLPPALAAATAGCWVQSPTALTQAPAGRLFALQQPLHAAAASDVRRQIAAGVGWQAQVPGAVADYITRTGLYRDGG